MNCEISVFKKCGKSNREIEQILNLSYDVVNNFLQLKHSCGIRKSPGRPSKLFVDKPGQR